MKILESIMGQSVSGWIIDALIIVFGLWVAIRLSSLHKEVKDVHEEAKKNSESVKGEDIYNMATGMMQYTVKSKYDPASMDSVRSKYNELSGRIHAWSQTISIFPLLGLLGTVMGIIPGLASTANGDFTALQSQLSVALYSTFIGLIFSILLKGQVANYSKTFSDVEDFFEEFDRKYNLALNYQRVIVGNKTDDGNIEDENR